MKMRTTIISVMSAFVLLCSTVALKMRNDLLPVPESFISLISNIRMSQILDRYGRSLTITYQNRWNCNDYLPLHEIPEFLQQAFVIAEDKRFFYHSGVDWRARLHAAVQNIFSLSVVRGASTITEQVVRMMHHRPRTLWSRWLEGFEAAHLESKATKADILEFYLNQVPYAKNRRGVAQAARYYFNRDLHTLSHKEMIALSILVRAPSSLDLYKNPEAILPSVRYLSGRLKSFGLLTEREYMQILNEDFQLAKLRSPIYASHFVNYMYSTVPYDFIQQRQRLSTTLDARIQNLVQGILDQSINRLRKRGVINGAALVVDHRNQEVLAWVNGGEGNADIPGSFIDAVSSLRQPGSSLKPFLYAMALERGWTAATLIDDSPIINPVGHGLHSYQNFSRLFYGPVSLREALGNSLNIPAIRTIQFIGVDHYLSCLRRLGFKNLIQHPDYYGDGLALGNGEVTLFELVQAYTVLANQGIFSPLRVLRDYYFPYESRRIFSKEATSLIAHILSDPEARILEFGNGSLLNFPVQTAVKTGTSSDYRDAWAVGFNYHYTAGVWMGNLDGSPMEGVTGSHGPAMVLRSIFTELNRFGETRPLYLSPMLVKRDICDKASKALDGICLYRTEWFIAGTGVEDEESECPEEDIRLVRPSKGLQLAMDPRIPDEEEAFEFFIEGINEKNLVVWEIDDMNMEKRHGGRYLWPLRRGPHTVRAAVVRENDKPLQTEKIHFHVK